MHCEWDPLAWCAAPVRTVIVQAVTAIVPTKSTKYCFQHGIFSSLPLPRVLRCHHFQTTDLALATDTRERSRVILREISRALLRLRVNVLGSFAWVLLRLGA